MPALVVFLALALVASGINAVLWAQPATAASPNFVTPSVPALPNGIKAVPPPGRQVAPARPAGDFSTLTKAGDGAGSHFDPKRSMVVSRTMYTTEYLNPDGTHSIQESTAPLNAQDATGRWQPVDTSLATTSGSARHTARRQALNPSLAATANDPSILSVHYDGDSASWRWTKPQPASPVTVAKDHASYANVLPGTDLDYQVTLAR